MQQVGQIGAHTVGGCIAEISVADRMQIGTKTLSKKLLSFVLPRVVGITRLTFNIHQ